MDDWSEFERSLRWLEVMPTAEAWHELYWCPACASPEVRTALRTRIFTKVCPECGSVFVEPLFELDKDGDVVAPALDEHRYREGFIDGFRGRATSSMGE